MKEILNKDLERCNRRGCSVALFSLQ